MQFRFPFLLDFARLVGNDRKALGLYLNACISRYMEINVVPTASSR